MTDIQNIIPWDKKCSTLIPFFVFLLSLQAVKQNRNISITEYGIITRKVK